MAILTAIEVHRLSIPKRHLSCPATRIVFRAIASLPLASPIDVAGSRFSGLMPESSLRRLKMQFPQSPRLIPLPMNHPSHGVRTRRIVMLKLAHLPPERTLSVSPQESTESLSYHHSSISAEPLSNDHRAHIFPLTRTTGPHGNGNDKTASVSHF